MDGLMQWESNDNDIIVAKSLFVKQKRQPTEEHRPKKLLDHVRNNLRALLLLHRGAFRQDSGPLHRRAQAVTIPFHHRDQ
jgi:hypothetical protein